MTAKTALTLKRGKDCFTHLDLIGKAANYKGLVLQEVTSKPYSKPIATYILDDKLLALLAESGIKRQYRPDCRDKIFTLIDENPQQPSPGYAASNYWNFKLADDGKNRFDLLVTLAVGFAVNIEKRGVEFWPQAFGTSVSAGDHLPKFRMFKALVESGRNLTLSVTFEIARSDGHIVVTWTDLGLGGIRKMYDLFREFAKGNETIRWLALNGEVFDPAPYPRQQPADELFIVEPAQPKVIAAWREQLADYRAALIV
ncbi:MAG: hypothetical protein Q8Q41_04185 [bacterium]|nr:hypothetical protein [bacterium]